MHHACRVFGLGTYGCAIGLVVWMIICVFGGVYLRKRERARAKLRTLSFAHFCVPKDYFG